MRQHQSWGRLPRACASTALTLRKRCKARCLGVALTGQDRTTGHHQPRNLPRRRASSDTLQAAAHLRSAGRQRAPVVLSSADTFRMPLASMSNTTLICGTPRGAGGMPLSSNLPSRLLSRVRDRSPSYTCPAPRAQSLCGSRRPPRPLAGHLRAASAADHAIRLRHGAFSSSSTQWHRCGRSPRFRQRPRACTRGMRAAQGWLAERAWISTPGWLSLYVLNTCSFLVGMVVLRVISVVCASQHSRSAPMHVPPLPGLGALGARQLGHTQAPHHACTVSADPHFSAVSLMWSSLPVACDGAYTAATHQPQLAPQCFA